MASTATSFASPCGEVSCMTPRGRLVSPLSVCLSVPSVHRVLSIIAGDVQLEGLTLRRAALNELNLPIIVKGTCREGKRRTSLTVVPFLCFPKLAPSAS